MWVDLLSPPAYLWKCVMSFAALLLTITSQAVLSLCIIIFFSTNEMDEAGF